MVESSRMSYATPAPPVRRGFLRSVLYPVLRPVYRPAHYYYSLLRVRTAGLNVCAPRAIAMDCSHAEIAQRMKQAVAPRADWMQVALASDTLRRRLDSYFEQHRETTPSTRDAARLWSMRWGWNCSTSVACAVIATSLPAPVRCSKRSLRIFRKSNSGCRT